MCAGVSNRLFPLFGFAFAACFLGPKAPEVEPSRALELSADSNERKPMNGPFGVVFGSPEGQVRGEAEVNLVFNRPMRALTLAGAEPPAPATIAYKQGGMPKGSWRWLGTQALTFVPESHLPDASEYVVTVPQGTKALAGDSLAKPFTIAFSTRRPELEETLVVNKDDSERVVPTSNFELTFNLPMDAKALRTALHLTALPLEDEKAKERELAFTLKGKTDRTFLLTPSAPLPLASKIYVHASAEMRSIEGPLPSAKEVTRDFETYSPLAVTAANCNVLNDKTKRCDPAYGITLEFNNPVKIAELKNFVQVDPPIAMAWSKDSYNSSSFSLPGRTAPATRYKVTVAPGLHDMFGQTLGKGGSFDVVMGDETPSLRVGIQGTHFEAKRPIATRTVPVGTLNVESYDLYTAPLSEEALVGLLKEDSDRFGRLTSFAKHEHVTPASARNRMAVKTVVLDTVAKSGALALGIEARVGRELRTSKTVHIASVSDLAITAKLSRYGSLVWVSKLSDGAFVPGASVSIRNPSGAIAFSGKTDANGMLAIPPDVYRFDGTQHDVMFARLGEDWTFHETQEQLDTWRFGTGFSVDLEAKPRLTGMLITDRGVYRPGETVRTKLYFREPMAKGTRTPVGRVIDVEAHDMNGNVVFEKKGLALGAFGELAIDVPIPQTAPLGDLAIYAKAAEGDGSAAANVMLAAYKAAEFKVAIEPEKPSYVRGDTASYAVRGDFLFGAPMAGASVEYRVNRSTTHFAPPGFEEFTVGDSVYKSGQRNAEMHGGALQSGKGALDAKGSYAVKVPLTGPFSGEPETYALEGEVKDLSRRTQSAQSAVIVHPASFYLGMRDTEDGFLSAPSVYKPKVIAADIKGGVRAGVAVHLDLIKRSYATSVEDTGDGYGRSESRAVDKVVRGCDLTSAREPSSCDLAIDEAGYYVVRATAKDERGNTAATSTSVYATGGEARVAWDWQERNALGLIVDKKVYEPGQTARILVKSPFKEADALVTVERAGVYEQKRIHVTGAMPVIPVQITEAMRPNAFVAVQLIRGRSSEPKGNVDLTGPSFRLGYAELSVNPEGKRLTVKATPSKTDARPGETVNVDLLTKDRAGKGVTSDVTLYVVDEGVLMLTGYKVPDPIPVFGAARSLNVAGYDTRDRLAKLLRVQPGAGLDKGEEGGGGGAEGSVRSDFRATAHFSSVRTGADGSARVSVKLPDGLTTYRVMAVAASEDDRFGFAENNVVTSKPLMGRPVLPRFLRAGDRAQAGVIVTSKGLPASTVTVSIETEGVTVEGPREKTLSLPASGSMEVSWPTVAGAPGEAKFFFKVRGPVGADDVVVKRTVDVPMSPETVALYGETDSASAERLGALSNARPDFGSLDLRVSSTALVGLESSMEALMQYPYGCTEQMTSRLVPYVLMQDFAKLYGFALAAKGQKPVDEALEKILKNQQADGGFGWWPDSQTSDPWLSTYAVWGLTIAKQKGKAVPEQALERATAFLQRHMRTSESRLNADNASFIVDVLAERGTFDDGAISELLAKQLSLKAQAHLAHALALSKKRPKELKALLQGLEQHVHQTPTAAVLVEEESRRSGLFVDSDARLTALAIRAFIAAEPKHAMAPRLTRGLLNMRKKGAWRSTIENASALVALEDYRRAQEADGASAKARAFLGKTFLEEYSFGVGTQSKTTSIPMQKAAGLAGEALAFQATGGKIFYEARVKYSPKELPSEAIERGFYVQKWVREVTPESLTLAMGTLPAQTASSVRGGELALVDVIVVATDPQDQVVVDDPLPAGFEAIDTRLRGGGSAASKVEAEGNDDSDDERSYNSDGEWFHREIRDDRVLTFVEHMASGTHHYRYLVRATTLGTFVVPPTKAECMYEPETFGRTAGSTMVVK
jgi:alpha-2-macroglobulin